MKLSLIPLSDVVSRIGVRDIRTAQRWCEKNGITIHQCNKKKLIYDADFNRVLQLKYIEGLKSYYPNTYQQIYQETQSDNFLIIFELLNNIKEKEKNRTTTYIPQGEIAKDFLNDIIKKKNNKNQCKN